MVLGLRASDLGTEYTEYKRPGVTPFLPTGSLCQRSPRIMTLCISKKAGQDRHFLPLLHPPYLVQHPFSGTPAPSTLFLTPKSQPPPLLTVFFLPKGQIFSWPDLLHYCLLLQLLPSPVPTKLCLGLGRNCKVRWSERTVRRTGGAWEIEGVGKADSNPHFPFLSRAGSRLGQPAACQPVSLQEQECPNLVHPSSSGPASALHRGNTPTPSFLASTDNL